jgi:two-component system, NarL family, response regulator NreC
VPNRFGIQVDGEGRRDITIVLADDHTVMRSGLKALLEEERDLSVVAEAEDVDAALSAVGDHLPAVVVLDLNMPGSPTMPAISKIVATSPRTAVILLTMQDEPAFVREALRSGARGYVVKSSAGAELVNAIRTAADGGTYLNPALAARVAGEGEDR